MVLIYGRCFTDKHMCCHSDELISCSNINVTTRFSLTCDDRLWPANVVNTTKPNNTSTMAVLIHNVTACKPERLPVLFCFFNMVKTVYNMPNSLQSNKKNGY